MGDLYIIWYLVHVSCMSHGKYYLLVSQARRGSLTVNADHCRIFKFSLSRIAAMKSIIYYDGLWLEPESILTVLE